MPKKERYLESLIREYELAVTKRGRVQAEHARKYCAVLRRVLGRLESTGRTSAPTKISEDDVDWLLKSAYKDLRPSTVRGYITVLNCFLKWQGNDVIDRMMIGWPQDMRVRVDWLSPEETVLMLEAAKGVERIVVHFELVLGMRRCEVMRLRMQDVQTGIVEVLGKGKHGGKWRTLAWAPDTLKEIQDYMQLRERMIEEARRRSPGVAVPETFVIYRKGRRLGSYGKTAMDNIIRKVGARAGIQRPVGHHTNRRSSGRNQHYAGVGIEEISEFYGHSDTKTTMRYLGLTVNDLASAQESQHAFLETVRDRIKGKSPSEISVPLLRVSR